jgi:uroporphyrinogen decarboxylase
MGKTSSKERVLTAVELKEPDRVPMDFNANPPTLTRLKSDLNCSDHYTLLKKIGSDIIDLRGIVDPIYKGPVPKEQTLENGVKQNYWGWRTKIEQTATGPEEMFYEFILAGKSLEEIKNHCWPKVDWFDFSDFSDKIQKWNEFAVMASGPSIWQHPSFLRGLDTFMADLLLEVETAEFLMDCFTEFYITYFDKMFSVAPGQVDILRIADDIGMQNGLIMSREMLLKFILPRLKKIVDMAHSHDVKVMFHSCGSIIEIIDDIIDVGVDILDPIQVTAKGMDPAFLKNKFGNQICMHGAIDTQYLLPQGSPDEISRVVKKMADILGKGGGYILSPSHVLQTDVPTENILSLYETGRKTTYN